jgi:hypothetical protein
MGIMWSWATSHKTEGPWPLQTKSSQEQILDQIIQIQQGFSSDYKLHWCFNWCFGWCLAPFPPSDLLDNYILVSIWRCLEDLLPFSLSSTPQCEWNNSNHGNNCKNRSTALTELQWYFYYRYSEVPLILPSIFFWHTLFAIYFYKQHHVAGETDGCISTIDSRWFRKESEECTMHSRKQNITILTQSNKFNEVFFSTSGILWVSWRWLLDSLQSHTPKHQED